MEERICNRRRRRREKTTAQMSYSEYLFFYSRRCDFIQLYVCVLCVIVGIVSAKEMSMHEIYDDDETILLPGIFFIFISSITRITIKICHHSEWEKIVCIKDSLSRRTNPKLAATATASKTMQTKQIFAIFRNHLTTVLHNSISCAKQILPQNESLYVYIFFTLITQWKSSISLSPSCSTPCIVIFGVSFFSFIMIPYEQCVHETTSKHLSFPSLFVHSFSLSVCSLLATIVCHITSSMLCCVCAV